MNNYKLTLSYDGSRYRGWQRQGNTENTIQGKVEAALSRMLGQEIEISGSGRTDAGAHARMQVASFRAETGMDTSDILSRLREALPEDACDAFGTNDTAGPLSELLYVGFWTDRGNADSDALALLARLRKKKIFLSHPDAEDLEALKNTVRN